MRPKLTAALALYVIVSGALTVLARPANATASRMDGCVLCEYNVSCSTNSTNWCKLQCPGWRGGATCIDGGGGLCAPGDTTQPHIAILCGYT